jgi:hypothetical protein
METGLPVWMEFVVMAATAVACVISLKIIDRFQQPKE